MTVLYPQDYRWDKGMREMYEDLESINKINKEYFYKFDTEKLSELKSETKDSHRNDLKNFFIWNKMNNGDVSFDKMSENDINHIIQEIINSERLTFTKSSNLVMTIHVFCRWYNENYSDKKDLKKIIKRKNIYSVLNAHYKMLSVEDVEKIKEYYKKHYSGFKNIEDKCLLYLMAYSDLNYVEILNLKVKDININDTFFDGKIIGVKTKNRIKYIIKSPFTRYYKAFLRCRAKTLAKKGKKNQYLFIRKNGSRIKTRYFIYNRLYTWGNIVGRSIGVKDFTHHYYEKLNENGITPTKLARLDTGKYGNENYEGISYNDLHISKREWGKLFNDERLNI